MSPNMQLTAQLHGTRLVIAPAGRLDSLSAPLLEQQLSADVDGGNHDLVIDLSALDYISSKGLSALLSVGKKVKRHDGRMVLAGLSDHVQQVVLISGFERIFEIYPSVDAALGAA